MQMRLVMTELKPQQARSQGAGGSPLEKKIPLEDRKLPFP